MALEIDVGRPALPGDGSTVEDTVVAEGDRTALGVAAPWQNAAGGDTVVLDRLRRLQGLGGAKVKRNLRESRARDEAALSVNNVPISMSWPS